MDDGATSGHRAAPPTSRVVAMFAIVFVVLALIGAAAWFVGGDASPERGACSADARLDPASGRSYGRDPDHDCRFVDEDGNVLTDQ